MKKLSLVIPFALLAMTGCSKTSDYAPAAGATGEQIFTAACAECHEKTDGKIFELSADEASVAAISKKVSEGGMMMPSFPGIKGEALTGLSQYVVENSKAK
ncbi:c-type cytochrome [Pseudomonadota bacterium]